MSAAILIEYIIKELMDISKRITKLEKEKEELRRRLTKVRKRRTKQ